MYIIKNIQIFRLDNCKNCSEMQVTHFPTKIFQEMLRCKLGFCSVEAVPVVNITMYLLLQLHFSTVTGCIERERERG